MLLYMCLLAVSLFGSNLHPQQDVNPENLDKPSKTSFIDLPDEIKSQIFSYIDRKKLSLVSSHIASLKNENIKEIKISKMQGVTEKTLTDILNKLPRLQSIQFTGQDYNEDAFNTLISQIFHYKNITELSFEDRSWVTDDIIKNFNSLENIRSLNLSCCNNITDAGLKRLPPYLTHLDLTGCEEITGAGLKRLPPHLTYLNLKWCYHITNVDLKDLSIALSYLNLSYCHTIRDTGLIHLYQLKDLKSIDLTGCNIITEQGIQKLTNKLPNLTIQH